MTTIKSNEVSNWIFNKCPVTDIWRTAKKEHYNDMFNDFSSKNVLRSSSINTLIELITKFEGDISKINEYVRK